MAKYVDYAMGEDLSERMPLWIKPDEKLDVLDIMDLMRDYYQNTPMDMRDDIGAGPFGCTVRWRPLTWDVEGETYFNERAISTQQTGFSFVAQSRNWLPDPIGGILWFGVDDTYYTAYSPMYCGINEIPESFAVGNGDIMTFSDGAAFWVFNQVSNFAYSRSITMDEDIRKVQKDIETSFAEETSRVDRIAKELYKEDPEMAVKYLTEYSKKAGNNTVGQWKKLYVHLFTRFMDGNIKEKRAVPEGYKYVTPEISQPGYSKTWYKNLVKSTGDKFREK